MREDHAPAKARSAASARPGRPRGGSSALDSPLLFPAARGGYIELNKWRDRVWRPALISAGIEHRRIYDLRHTYATWSLAAGVSLFALSRRMGTSLAMTDATYGHLAPDAEDQERALLDAFDAERGPRVAATVSRSKGIDRGPL
jgi:integrase